MHRRVSGKKPWRKRLISDSPMLQEDWENPRGLVSSSVDMPFPWGATIINNLVINVRTLAKAYSRVSGLAILIEQ